jgi:Lon protease-like protein
VRVEQWLPDDPYPRGLVAAVDDPPADAAARSARDRLLDALRELYEELASVDASASDVVVALADDPVRASYEAARFVPLGALDAQRVLEMDGAQRRIEAMEAVVHERLQQLRADPG